LSLDVVTLALAKSYTDKYGGGGGGDPGTSGYIIGDGLKLEGRRLSVDTATTVDEDNTKPITSAAVFTEIGNINALLETI
jgi:hypothetical protein